MERETQNIPLAAKAAIAAFAIAWLMLMGWAAGDAWEHDGLAHSGQAFGQEYESNQGE